MEPANIFQTRGLGSEGDFIFRVKISRGPPLSPKKSCKRTLVWVDGKWVQFSKYAIATLGGLKGSEIFHMRENFENLNFKTPLDPLALRLAHFSIHCQYCFHIALILLKVSLYFHLLLRIATILLLSLILTFIFHYSMLYNKRQISNDRSTKIHETNAALVHAILPAFQNDYYTYLYLFWVLNCSR